MPAERIPVNLAPGSLKKTGSGFDLPIAAGILAATGQIDANFISKCVLIGELSLEGEVRLVPGLLSIALTARKNGLNLLCPVAPEHLVDMENISMYTIDNLRSLYTKEFKEADTLVSMQSSTGKDFKDISGHKIAKRAMQIAATGNHGLLMMGPPGSGKTMLAERMPSILPDLNEEEMLEAAVVHSVAGESLSDILAGKRPFRKPHHSASLPGLVGGNTPIRPGEISLAHRGVLFLDELAEFKPSVLQGIRQPMESGEVCITRADGNVLFPARFSLLAASNPCPCGFYGDKEIACSCAANQVITYQNRIGGPLIDRFDMNVDVSRIPANDVLRTGNGTSSAQLKEGVIRGIKFAQKRKVEMDGKEPVKPKDIVDSCNLSEADKEFLGTTAKQKMMSGRAIVSVLRVARTIADIEQSPNVRLGHLSEALAFRLREQVGAYEQ